MGFPIYNIKYDTFGVYGNVGSVAAKDETRAVSLLEAELKTIANPLGKDIGFKPLKVVRKGTLHSNEEGVIYNGQSDI